MHKPQLKPQFRPSSSLSFKCKTDTLRQLEAPTREQLRRSSSSIKINAKPKDGYYGTGEKAQNQIRGRVLRNKGESSAESSFTKIISNTNVNANMKRERKNIKIQTQPIQKKYDSKMHQSKDKALIRQKYQHVIGWTEVDKVKYQLNIQKRLRESLERQNQVLKKQVAFLNNFGASLRGSINNNKKTGNEEILCSNKQKILNRLNRKRDGVTSLADKDNESTGLCSGKTKTYQQKIHQIYDQYAKKRTIPQAELVYEIASNYFKDYQDNYSKLYILFNQSKTPYKTQLTSKMQDLLFLFQVPILYKQRPRQLLKSLSKQKLQANKSKQNSCENSFDKIRVNSINDGNPRIQDVCIQYKSPTQILAELELLIGLVIKNSKLLSKFVSSEVCGKLIRKIKQKQQ